MPIDSWRLSQMQSPAVELCNQLGEHPYEPLDPADFDSPQRWQFYARKMAEHALMVACMRNAGIPV